MLAVSVQIGLILAGALFVETQQKTENSVEVAPDFFEGRWAFSDESCDAPGNWTMIAGGNFVSEDLVGSWIWDEGKLTLNLTDLAIDEETGEAGGRFQMDGPVKVVDPDSFVLTIVPDSYHMKRCEE